MKYNAVSTAGLFMGGEEGRKDKTTHKLASSRTSFLSYFLIQRKEARMFWRLLIRDKDDRVRKAETAPPETSSILAQTPNSSVFS